jgi:hypothetical protein
MLMIAGNCSAGVKRPENKTVNPKIKYLCFEVLDCGAVCWPAVE